MSVTRIAIIGLAAGSAIAAAFLAKGFIGKEPEKVIVKEDTVEKVQVLIVAKSMNMGDRLDGSRVGWKDWPKSLVLPSMITKSAKPDAVTTLEGSRAKALMVEGEPVLEKKIIKPSDSGFLAAILPKGMRAVAVEVSVRTGAGGFILPNDRVDVLLTRKVGNNNNERKATEVLLSNVRILAMDQRYDKGKEGESVAEDKIKTATLELEPKQAEVLTLMESTGSLTLVLRSLADVGDSELGDDKPVLSKKFAKGANGGEITIYRYGKPTSAAAN